MKNLIKNTILVLVMIFLGLFLVGCEKDNPQPEPDYTTTEGLITISTEADSVLVRIYSTMASESKFKVYKNEPKNIKIKGFDPRTYNINMTIYVYNDIYNSFIKPTSVKVIDHKNREVSYIFNGSFPPPSTGFSYQMNYTFIFTE